MYSQGPNNILYNHIFLPSVVDSMILLLWQTWLGVLATASQPLHSISSREQAAREESLFQDISRLASLLQNCFGHRRSALTYSSRLHQRHVPLANSPEYPLYDMAYVREHLLRCESNGDPRGSSSEDSLLQMPANLDGSLTIGDVVQQCHSLYGLRYFVPRESQSWPWRTVWFFADSPPGSDYAGDQRDLAFRVGTMCALSSDPALNEHADSLSTLAALASHGATGEDSSLAAYVAQLPHSSAESIVDRLASEVLGYSVSPPLVDSTKALRALFERPHLFVQQSRRMTSMRNPKHAFDWDSDHAMSSLHPLKYQRHSKPVTITPEAAALSLLRPTPQRSSAPIVDATHFAVYLDKLFEPIHLYFTDVIDPYDVEPRICPSTAYERRQHIISWDGSTNRRSYTARPRTAPSSAYLFPWPTMCRPPPPRRSSYAKLHSVILH